MRDCFNYDVENDIYFNNLFVFILYLIKDYWGDF